jgi:DNA (cytosine-5)-methyltransferase 1
MRGSSDKHDRWLWPEVIRVISEARPLYAVMENPTGLLSVDGGRAFAGILSELHSIGYDLWWETLGANAVGAFHRRERLWLLAADSKRCERGNQSHGGEAGRVGREQQPFSWNEIPESALRRLRGVDDGTGYTSHRVDTIRNSLVPQVAEIILKLTNPNNKETKNG